MDDLTPGMQGYIGFPASLSPISADPGTTTYFCVWCTGIGTGRIGVLAINTGSTNVRAFITAGHKASGASETTWRAWREISFVS